MTDYSNPWHQCGMVLDRLRVAAYAEAIARTVKPGDVVMDMGSGSGLLALLAARAGARKVYAVERTAAAAFVRAHAADNGCADVVEVIHADFNETALEDLTAKIRERPNVVVAEVLGNFAPEEGQHAAFRRARELARTDAVYIPASYELAFAPSTVDYVEPSARLLADVHGVRLLHLAQSMRAWPFTRRARAEDLAGPEIVGWQGPTTGAEPSEVTVVLPVTRDAVVRTVICNFVATLVPGIQITTSVLADETTWQSVAFPLPAPLECRAGESVTFRLLLPEIAWRRTWRWTAAR